ncbi:MAG: murein L,D-transpeptidase [Alphaproteobacteria bacterium]|nr:murein L,D-transpeptidase [Alphaproteobacteria bacterium]
MAATGFKQRASGFLASVALLAIAAAMIAGAALLESKLETLLGKRIGGFIASDDSRRVAIKRLWHSTYWAFGWTLPGTPDLASLDDRLKTAGLELGAPIFMRIFKREFELEIWLKKDTRFVRFASYPICLYSGRLGPKLKQGDHQSPEGIYTVTRSQLNPNSRWHRSFNLGFPNLYDRSHGRTGSFLMVHGGCSSIGCYAMTNQVVDEIWKLVTAALDGGQSRFQVQALPFRLSDSNLEERRHDPLFPFWSQLKAPYDLFEETGIPPEVDVCGKRYTAAPGSPGSDGTHSLTRSCKADNSMVTN